MHGGLLACLRAERGRRDLRVGDAGADRAAAHRAGGARGHRGHGRDSVLPLLLILHLRHRRKAAAAAELKW